MEEIEPRHEQPKAGPIVEITLRQRIAKFTNFFLELKVYSGFSFSDSVSFSDVFFSCLL